MGKDSLIKSTAKKKAAAKKKEKAKKTVTAKKAVPKKKPKAQVSQKAAKAIKKAAPKKKVKAPAPKATAAAKITPKKKAATKPKPAKKAAPKKKLSTKELLMKNFGSQGPAKATPTGPDTQAAGAFVAPPFFTDRNDAETKRLKALLLKKFDLPAAPADKPAEPVAPAETTPEPAPSETVAEKPAAPAVIATPETPPEPEPADDMPPPMAEEPADPAEKILKYMAAAFVLLIVLVIGASFVNQGRFYVNAADGAVEIWQGKFAPKGQTLLVALPGAELPEMADRVLAKQDVYPLAFNYYIDKADAILDVPGAPNFDEVKTYLQTALSYAFNQELRDIAYARLNNIDLLILMYKADVAGSRKTIASLEAGLAYLAEAKNLASDLQVQQIDQKIEAFGATLASLKAAQAEAEQLEADRQQLEQAEAVHQE